MADDSGAVAVPIRVNKYSFDDVLQVLGEFGKYQRIVYLMYCLPFLMTNTQFMSWVFTGAAVPFRCSGQQDWMQSCASLNASTVCTQGFEYDKTASVSSSALIEWDLVCDRQKWHAAVGSAPVVGYIIGGLIFGLTSDKFGRKITFLVSNGLLLVSGLCSSLAPDLYSFLTSRVSAGAAIAGVDNTCFVLGMEMVGPSKRTLAGILCWFFETGGLMLTLGLATVITDNWRLLQAVYTLPCLLFFGYIWLAPESVRWLMEKGRLDTAEQIIRRTARINGTTVPDEMLQEVLRGSEADSQQASQAKQARYSFLDLFRTRQMRIKTCILQLTWIVCSAMYYFLLLDQAELSDNRFIGFLITCTVQLPGYVFVILTIDRPEFGRKRSMCGLLMVASLCLTLHPLVNQVPMQKLIIDKVRIALSIVGRFCANCSYTILYMYSVELFPTVVRGVGVGFSTVVSRIGTMTAPFVLLSGSYSHCFIGLAALIAGLAALMLPETQGKKLPETIEDGEEHKIVTPACLKLLSL